MISPGWKYELSSAPSAPPEQEAQPEHTSRSSQQNIARTFRIQNFDSTIVFIGTMAE
jgi:pterin-4a-carbinolamine dehydratase